MLRTKFKENGIHHRHWSVDGDARAVVLLVHGLGEHCERYDTFADACNAAGYAVCSIDLPGHGHSDGLRGHINSMNEFSDAVLGLHSLVKNEYPDLPIFLFGHSMGGLIATQLLLDQQSLFSGALLSGAALESPQQPPAIQVFIVKLFAKLFPRMGVLTLDASGISRDPKVVETYMNDPLVNKGKLSARLMVELIGGMQRCEEEATTITLPIRIMHGSKDDMTAPAGSERLFNKVSSADKELKIYDGLMHEILNEPEGAAITAEIIAWMENR